MLGCCEVAKVSTQYVIGHGRVQGIRGLDLEKKKKKRNVMGVLYASQHSLKFRILFHPSSNLLGLLAYTANTCVGIMTMMTF